MLALALGLSRAGCAAPMYYHGSCQDLACELASGRPVKLVSYGFLWHQVTVDRAQDGKPSSAIREDLDRCYLAYLQNGRPGYLALVEQARTQSSEFVQWATTGMVVAGAGAVVGGLAAGSQAAILAGSAAAGAAGIVDITFQVAAARRMAACLRQQGYTVR